MPAPTEEPEKSSEQQEIYVRKALDALYEERESLEFSFLDYEQSEERYLVDVDSIFGGEDSDDVFYENTFLAAFVVEHDGLSFHFRFSVIHQEPYECEPFPFGGLIIQVFDPIRNDYLSDIGFSSDFSERYHQWRDYLSQRYNREI